jgi:hypothetical protein
VSSGEIPFGFVKDNDLYLKAWGQYPDRRIGEVKEEGLAAAVAYFEQKFVDLKGKIDDLTGKIESSDNKGSYLMKLLHLKEGLATHDGLGDYQSLADLLEKQEVLLRDIIAKNRDRNSEIKKALLAELQGALEVVNWKESTDKINDVKARWIKTGHAREDEHEVLEKDFWDHVQGFFDKKKQFYGDKKKLAEVRAKKYEDLIEEAAQALQGLKGKERFDMVKDLKARWQTVGNVPASIYKDMMYQFNRVLKGQPAPIIPNMDDISRTVQDMYDRRLAFNQEQLQGFRKVLAGFRPKDFDVKKRRSELMERINLVWERNFLEDLASRKTRGWDELPKSEKLEAMRRLLKDFIRRDKEDLMKFEDNIGNFSSHHRDADKMMERKLGQQRNKIAVKEKLLRILEAGLI